MDSEGCLKCFLRWFGSGSSNWDRVFAFFFNPLRFGTGNSMPQAKAFFSSQSLSTPVGKPPQFQDLNETLKKNSKNPSAVPSCKVEIDIQKPCKNQWRHIPGTPKRMFFFFFVWHKTNQKAFLWRSWYKTFKQKLKSINHPACLDRQDHVFDGVIHPWSPKNPEGTSKTSTLQPHVFSLVVFMSSKASRKHRS